MKIVMCCWLHWCWNINQLPVR